MAQNHTYRNADTDEIDRQLGIEFDDRSAAKKVFDTVASSAKRVVVGVAGIGLAWFGATTAISTGISEGDRLIKERELEIMRQYMPNKPKPAPQPQMPSSPIKKHSKPNLMVNGEDTNAVQQDLVI